MKDMVIELSGIKVLRRERMILAIDELKISAGELVGLVGANGAGKSTLLKVLNLQLAYQSGDFKLFGIAARGCDQLALRRRCALVFQENLLVSGTVFDNVALALRFRGLPEDVIREEVGNALEAFHCAHLAGRLANRLSGGEAQRVSLARALVSKPELLLLDEPFAALDAATRVSLLRELKTLATRSGMTVLLVSHNFSEVQSFAGRALVLAGGRIVQDDSPENVLRRPQSREAADLVEMDNILPCRVEREAEVKLLRMENDLTVRWPGEIEAESALLCIPGDAFSLKQLQENGDWRGTVLDCRAGIGVSRITVDVSGLTLSLCLPLQQKITAGTTVFLSFDAQQATLI